MDNLPFDLSPYLRDGFHPLIEEENNEVCWGHEQVKTCFSRVLAGDRQFNARNRSKDPIYDGTDHLDHWGATRTLIKYLCSEDFINPVKQAFEGDTWIQPQGPLIDFMAYAVHRWPAHYRKAIEQGSYAEAMLEYLKGRDFIQVWWGLKSRLGGMDVAPDMYVPNPLSLAAYLGFADVINVSFEV